MAVAITAGLATGGGELWADTGLNCEPLAGNIVSVEGSLQIRRAGTAGWSPAAVDMRLCERDTIRTGANSRAAIALINDAVFRLDQNTAVNLADITPAEEEQSFIDLLVGALQSFSRKPREIAVTTPYLNATIEGTEFVIRVARNETQLTVFEGTVRAANELGETAVTSGEMVVAAAGGPPERRIVVRPRDAAQWAIYYPPVLAALGGARPPADLTPVMSEAVALAGGGDAAGALEAMDRVPAAQQDARWHLYRASFLLAAGQVDAARTAIDGGLALDPNNSLAYALRAVIDVAQSRNDEALSNSRRAVELAPDSAVALIARSYALQANYELDEARRLLEHGVAANPDDALAHARLAELWMMVGYRGRARAEAERAVEIAPNLERAQVVLGFAALVETRTGQAKAAFNKAIALDSDDPLPHLGVGLALIREGDLAEGRRRIEAAVALDPQDALLRAYLGKAYFEERRAPLDGEQLAIAKDLDPNDPTAWLYDAIRKQSENRPGDALRDLEKSIELNDSRAVYRGRLQLDEDRAARGASLARVYSDLGFTRAGLNEAMKSLGDDPANASAHRFLADTYAGMRRHEIARVSEQLQAQMLQDININPVSPSGSTANLATSAGPATAGFNEYSALFERNRFQLDARGEYGSNDTRSGEGVLSVVHDRLSLSAGGYSYLTDGWRENAAIDHDIQNVYAQAALTPDLNVQLEYRHRESTSGDLAMNFDPDVFSSTLETELEQDIWRAGVRYSPTPSSDVLLSYLGSKRDGLTTEIEDQNFGGFAVIRNENRDQIEDDGDQYEAQYLYRLPRANLTMGGGYSDVVRDRDVVDIVAEDFAGFPPFIPPLPAGTVLTRTSPLEDIEHRRGYIYVNGVFPDAVTWTLGGSYDDYDREGAEVEEWNPKFGVQWDVTDSLRLRGAAFKVVKPLIVANRTIEPTQIAGFNQLFDDSNGTVSKAYGLGLDWRPADALYMGIEGLWRDYEEVVGLINAAINPLAIPSPGVFRLSDPVEREERIIRGYTYWSPIPSLALSVEAIHDRYTSDPGPGSDFFPKEVVTTSVPVGVRYFHPSGFFATAGATYVHQDVARHPASSLPEGTESFVTVGAGLGWRLRGGGGLISLEASNLLDEEFRYQDDGFREFQEEPLSSPYIPERTIMGRLTLRF